MKPINKRYFSVHRRRMVRINVPGCVQRTHCSPRPSPTNKADFCGFVNLLLRHVFSEWCP